MKKLIILAVAKLAVAVTAKHLINKAIAKAAAEAMTAAHKATPKKKPAQPMPPKTAKGLQKAVNKQCDGSLISVKETAVKAVVSVKPQATVIVPESIMPERTMADAMVKRTPVNFFERKFESIEKTVVFNPAWKNGTGYFDELLDDADLIRSIPFSHQVKCVDDSGRRLIITNTQLGPVVVFQRYTEGTDTIVYNARRVFQSTGLIKTDTRLTEKEIKDILGSIGDDSISNIGKKVDIMLTEVYPETQDVRANA